MKQYNVYKRGCEYRIAKPGWLFWHWVREYSMLSSWIFQTNSFQEAQKRAARINEDWERKCKYKRDRWGKV